MKDISKPLRIIIMASILIGLCLIIGGGIYTVTHKSDEVARHTVGVPIVASGFIISGIGNIILAVCNLKNGKFFGKKAA